MPSTMCARHGPGWVSAVGLAAVALVTFVAGMTLGWRSLMCLVLLVLCAIPAGTSAGDTEDRIPVVIVALVLWVARSLIVLGAGTAFSRSTTRTSGIVKMQGGDQAPR